MVITMGLMHRFNFFVSSTTHVCKLKAQANSNLHMNKSFGALVQFKTLLKKLW